MKKFFIALFLIVIPYFAFPQIEVAVKLDEILANSWAEFQSPTNNIIKVLEIKYIIKDKNEFYKDVTVGNASPCFYWISYSDSRTEWHKVPVGMPDILGVKGSLLYATKFTIPEFINFNYEAEVIIKMKGFNKNGYKDLCDCNDKLKWDPSINCIWTPWGTKCLGGFVGPSDKYCNQEYEVKFTINSSTIPYKTHYSGRQNSENGRYGANFSYHITAPPTLAPKPGTIDLPNSYNFLGTDAKITQETVCTGEPLSLTATGGFEGVRGYRWFINGNFFTYTPVQTGM